MAVDRQGRKARPQPCPRDAMVEARHPADAWTLKRGDYTAEVIGSDPDVAVGQDDDIMADAVGHVDEVRDLLVRAVPASVDHELEGALRQLLDQPGRDRYGGIVWALDAEDDLNG